MKKMFIALACVIVGACSESNTSPSERIPSYAGTWSGAYTVASCTQTGEIATANVCGVFVGSAPYGFNLTQNTRNVTGSFTLGSIAFPSTAGTIASDGALALKATTVSNGITIAVSWALNNPGNALTGTITQRWTTDLVSGEVMITGGINTAVKTASLPVASQPQTVGDLLRAITGVPAPR